MATPQLSPGVLVREVDLTVGRASNVLDNIGAIAGPFPLGPVDDPIDVTTEQDLIGVFGKPLSTDSQYEYWMSASSYLSYGGVLKVVRTNGANLKNANAGVGIASTTTLCIKNYDDYINNYDEATNYNYAAKNPGSWANGLKVCTIDDLADQRVGVATTAPDQSGATIGFGVTSPISTTIAGLGTTTAFVGYLKGIITGINTDASGGASTLDIKVVSRVETVGGGATETRITYAESNAGASFVAGEALHFVNSSGINSTGLGYNVTASTVTDWYDQQTLSLTNSTVFWKTLAPKPIANNYSTSRNGYGDAIHVVVVDDEGTISGVQGNILEKHISLSKAIDAVSNVNAPQKVYYQDYLADFSANLFAAGNPSNAADTHHNTVPRAVGFTAVSGTKSESFTPVTVGGGLWGQSAQDTTFSALGNVSYTLGGGRDYSGGIPATGDNGGMSTSLGNLQTSYQLFENKDEIEVDYLIMGPGLSNEQETQAKANYLISLAEGRKDCMAVIGPHRANLVNVTNTTTQTDNLVQYYSVLNSSSYATFDTGYKFTYDRFNNKFRYIPTNADVAGLMARTALEAYPWFSPAGEQRGVINNAIKLAYNPTKAQRDKLYPLRINSLVTKPGVGTLLFGDKTALSYASAFDRINVRRLFLTVEQALERAAEAQLFELNDELTRANFRNIVEPYLRDVQAKRGLFGFLVVCDTSNNTPDVIDNNEFRADIFLKPAKSINFITLSFIATRTGISFEEVAGRV